VLVAEVDDLDDVRVVDARGEARLVEEHGLELGVVADRREHRLDGDELLEAPRSDHARGPHGRHPAVRDGHEDLVAAQRVARLDVG
jgi:hypothetical protein